MLERALGHVAGQVARPEHLLEVQGLALVDDVERQLRIERLLAVEDRAQIRGVIADLAVALYQDDRRHLLLVAVARHADDESPVVGHGNATRLQVRHDLRNERLRVALALPQVEPYAEAGAL